MIINMEFSWIYYYGTGGEFMALLIPVDDLTVGY
ncbi:Uncharacterised protein [Salmonella enterica]|uniref:Uncharacterized protein n=1 Tax=Salmonella enterica TaxID=28901 RepID=A0A379QEA3_SALER|nr:Uncharacterised protein [Salmonella enterica]